MAGGAIERERNRAVRSRRGGAALVVATGTADAFTRLDHGAAAHGLDHHAVLVEQLEIDELVRREGKGSRAVGLHGDGAEDAFVVEVMPVHAGPLNALPVPAGLRPEALLWGLDYSQELHTAGLDAFHVRALIDVLHVHVAVRAFVITVGGDDRRARARGERPGAKAAGALGVEEDLVANTSTR